MSRATARSVALEVLLAVRASDAYSNLLLPARIARAGLSSQDAALATELTYGTLRGRLLYDAVLARAANRPAARIDADVLDLLRMGAHQLLAMRIPAHAVVDEAVRLTTGALRKRSASGFVNGVLRAIAREEPAAWRARAVEGLGPRQARAVLSAHPEWIVEALGDALAREGRADELDALLEADNAPPRVALAALPGLAEAAELGDPGRVSPIAALAPAGDPSRVGAVAEGRARVQDEGSQLAALALSRARPIAARERWLDLCAGPGGKAALLAAEAAGAGAELLANEVSAVRAGLVRRAVAAVEPAPTVVDGDGARFGAGHGDEAPARYDRVLLDAPCTGLGALRRRPEARWRRSPDDLAPLVALQARLVDAAVASLAPGGLLGYVTCSPHPAETTDQVDAALARHPRLRAVDTPAVLARIATRGLDLPDRPWAQLWPHRHGTDGMFVQLLTVD